MAKPFLSVIIPAFNEAKNYSSQSIHQTYAFLKKQAFTFEVVFVNDGSTDNTSELLNQFSNGKPEITIINATHQGKGPSVRQGMLAARGTARLFTDFDQSTPIKEVLKLLPYLEQGFEVVIGSREIDGAKREKEPWYRHAMGRGFNAVVKILTVKGIEDTQCGFKLFTSKATEDLFPKLRVMQSTSGTTPFTGAFDVELLFLAQRQGYKIKEVPVSWKHVATNRVSPLKDSIKMFVEVMKVRWCAMRGAYEN